MPKRKAGDTGGPRKSKAPDPTWTLEDHYRWRIRNDINEDGPVWVAVRLEEVDELRRALDDGHDYTKTTPNLMQPLHHAVTNSKDKAKGVELARLLLAAGADPNAWCGSMIRCVPLHYAAGE